MAKYTKLRRKIISSCVLDGQLLCTDGESIFIMDINNGKKYVDISSILPGIGDIIYITPTKDGNIIIIPCNSQLIAVYDMRQRRITDVYDMNMEQPFIVTSLRSSIVCVNYVTLQIINKSKGHMERYVYNKPVDMPQNIHSFDGLGVVVVGSSGQIALFDSCSRRITDTKLTMDVICSKKDESGKQLCVMGIWPNGETCLQIVQVSSEKLHSHISYMYGFNPYSFVVDGMDVIYVGSQCNKIKGHINSTATDIEDHPYRWMYIIGTSVVAVANDGALCII